MPYGFHSSIGVGVDRGGINVSLIEGDANGERTSRPGRMRRTRSGGSARRKRLLYLDRRAPVCRGRGTRVNGRVS